MSPTLRTAQAAMFDHHVSIEFGWSLYEILSVKPKKFVTRSEVIPDTRTPYAKLVRRELAKTPLIIRPNTTIDGVSKPLREHYEENQLGLDTTVARLGRLLPTRGRPSRQWRILAVNYSRQYQFRHTAFIRFKFGAISFDAFNMHPGQWSLVGPLLPSTRIFYQQLVGRGCKRKGT